MAHEHESHTGVETGWMDSVVCVRWIRFQQSFLYCLQSLVWPLRISLNATWYFQNRIKLPALHLAATRLHDRSHRETRYGWSTSGLTESDWQVCEPRDASHSGRIVVFWSDDQRLHRIRRNWLPQFADSSGPAVEMTDSVRKRSEENSDILHFVLRVLVRK